MRRQRKFPVPRPEPATVTAKTRDQTGPEANFHPGPTRSAYARPWPLQVASRKALIRASW